MKKTNKKHGLFVFLLVVAVFAWLCVAFSKNRTYFDEGAHLRQIKLFMRGKYVMTSGLTTIPGYHLAVAVLAKPFISPRHVNPTQVRLISLALSLVSIGIFYLVAQKVRAGDPLTRTLQFIFLPLVFFYFPFIYTDIFSLLWVLVAFYFALNKKYNWSAIFSLLALLVRQTNIVWVAFFWVYTYVLENDFAFSWKKFFDHLRRGAGYVAAALLFLVFVFLNKGVAIGDKKMQEVGFYTGNVYFFLALVGILFLPLSLAYFKKAGRAIYRQKLFWAVAAGLVLGALFLIFPPAVHEYNLKMKFLRNIILSYAYHQYVWSYALAILLGSVTLVFMDFEKKDWLILPFAVVRLIPSLLVEQRYMIVPVVFILLLRKSWSPKVEFGLLAYFILLSVGLVLMFLRLGLFF